MSNFGLKSHQIASVGERERQIVPSSAILDILNYACMTSQPRLRKFLFLELEVFVNLQLEIMHLQTTNDI